MLLGVGRASDEDGLSFGGIVVDVVVIVVKMVEVVKVVGRHGGDHFRRWRGREHRGRGRSGMDSINFLNIYLGVPHLTIFIAFLFHVIARAFLLTSIQYKVGSLDREAPTLTTKPRLLAFQYKFVEVLKLQL